MIRDLPNDEDNRWNEEASDATPTPEPNETQSSAPEDPPMEEIGNAASDATSDVSPEFAPTDIEVDQVGAESMAAPPVDAVAPVSPPEPTVGQSDGAGDSATVEPQNSPSPIDEGSFWANATPAPGYADPVTGKLRPVFGNVVSPAKSELFQLVYGLRPDFEPESSESAADPTTPPPMIERAFQQEGGGAPPSFAGGSSEDAASPSVSVVVRVSATEGTLAQLSKGATRTAVEFARKEIGVVAQRLFELDDEIKIREANRRAVWGR